MQLSQTLEPSVGEKAVHDPTIMEVEVTEPETLVTVAAEMSTFGASAVGSFHTEARPDDPYLYQVGFGNRFSSESMYVYI